MFAWRHQRSKHWYGKCFSFMLQQISTEEYGQIIYTFPRSYQHLNMMGWQSINNKAQVWGGQVQDLFLWGELLQSS